MRRNEDRLKPGLLTGGSRAAWPAAADLAEALRSVAVRHCIGMGRALSFGRLTVRLRACTAAIVRAVPLP